MIGIDVKIGMGGFEKLKLVGWGGGLGKIEKGHRGLHPGQFSPNMWTGHFSQTTAESAQLSCDNYVICRQITCHNCISVTLPFISSAQPRSGYLLIFQSVML